MSQAPSQPLGCLDARRVSTFLRAIEELPNMGTLFTTDFSPTLGQDDVELIEALVEEGLLVTSPSLTERFRAYFGRLQRQTERAKARADIRRTLQTTEVQIRHASEKSDRGRLLKSKNERWEQANTLSNLEKKKDDLLRKEAAIASGDAELQSQYEVLRQALQDNRGLKFYGSTLVQLTHEGRFLLAVLDSFPQRHLRGRRLGDVLAVGPLLM